MGVEVNGLADVFEDLDDLEDDFTGPTEPWVVGTNVEYSIYLEFGTSSHPIEADEAEALRFESGGEVLFRDNVEHPGIDPMPFFRPAVNEVRLEGEVGFIRHHTRKEPEDIDTVREFVSTLALALENRIKEIITRKGLIDTGNLRNSVQAVPVSDVGNLKD